MYHHPVLQRDDSDRLSRPDRQDAMEREHHTSPPAPASYGFSPQHSKTSTPAPLSLQPSFANHNPPPTSPQQTALPPISAAVFGRETPASKYYDPTQDAGDRNDVARPGGHYDGFPQEVRVHIYFLNT